jgi:CPA2 family monovalent cation:H+ antiporter-2
MDILIDIGVIFALSVAAVLVCHRLRIPSIVGFLLAGVLAGPHGFGLVRAPEQVEILSEVGVVMLLFVIGMEFSLRGLVEIRRSFLVGGTVQLLGTAAIVAGASYVMGRTAEQSVFLGFVVALSSTAIVLKLLQDRAEVDSPHGRLVLGTLIYQDLAVVPLILAVPFLAGAAGATDPGSWWLLAFKIAVVAAISYVSYRWVVPWLLYQIARTRSREAFLLVVLAICVGIALLTSFAGLSLALGAFLAGLIISESEYSHQAVGVILPFRDVFISLFFVSLGMLLDVSFVVENLGQVALLTAGVLFIKPLVAGGAALYLGLPLRNAVLAGVALGQIGEFSLVTAEVGVEGGLLAEPVFQLVLAVAVASMLLTPLMVAAGPKLVDLTLRAPLPPRLRNGVGPGRFTSAHPYEGHVVIVGFGVTGRNVARTARDADVPYAIVEISADTVRAERAAGEHIHYGDATQEAILHHVNAERAKAIVVVINDPAAARRVVELARRVAPNAYVIVRSRYLKEAEALYELGADEVIADELEVSIEVFSRVLARCLVPREDIERFAGEARAEWREMARQLAPEATSHRDLRVDLPDLATRSFRLSEHSPLVDHSIAESLLRADQGVTVLAVRRGADIIGNPVGATVMLAGDVLFVIGPEDWDPTPFA